MMPAQHILVLITLIVTSLVSGINLDAKIKLDRDPFKLLQVDQTKAEKKGWLFSRKENAKKDDQEKTSRLGAIFDQVKEARNYQVIVRGIIWDRVNPVVLIEVNGKTASMEKNDKIGNYTIQAIKQGVVIVMKGKTKLKLKVGQEKQL